MKSDTANELFSTLRRLLEPFARKLTVVHDDASRYHVDTHHVMANGQPLFFGAVRIGKRYVSYHLMPVYVEPSLLNDIPAALRKRMQGKSCFNFTTLRSLPLDDLAALTQRGYQLYGERGYINDSAVAKQP